MQQIDLEPTEFRRGPTRQHPLTNGVFMRAAVIAAVWFVLVVSYGRLFSPPVAWYLVALIAFGPGLMLAYIAISLDD